MKLARHTSGGQANDFNSLRKYEIASPDKSGSQ